MRHKTKEMLTTSLNAAATYVIPPLTLLRYGRLLLGGQNPDTEAGFRAENRDIDYVRLISRLFMPLVNTYFRTEVSGQRHIPPEGPCLIVGNHNAGLQPFDSFMTAQAIFETQGVGRPVYGLGHDYLFREPAFAALLDKIGLLRAHRRAATNAFAQGGAVIVYPGGDIDTFKPYSKRHTITFGGRKGFLKLALRSQVPIVPVVSIGCHETWFVLSRGEKIAALLRFKKLLRTEVFPIVVSLPWGLTSGFLPFFPLPAKVKLRFLEPLSWPQYTPNDAEDPQVLEQCYTQVVERMQTALDELAQERKYPLLG